MSNDEIELDFNKLGISKEKLLNFMKKHAVLFLVLIPVLLAAYIRLIPSTLPITDDWAKQSVDAYYHNQIKDQLRQQYPNLPDENIDSLINQQYSEFYRQNKELVNQQIKETSDQFKTQLQMENGYPYMPDIDPYQWLRYSEDYLDHGYVGDEIKNGVQWDNHMVAPKGVPASTRPHSILLAYMYKVMHAFNSDITPMQSANYFPVIFTALSVIPIFFIARMFSGNTGGFFAGMIMAVNGALLGRTTWGHADTDVYNVFFPAYFIWFFFLALKEHNTKKRAVYSALSGLSIGLFALFWIGWWYVFDFALGTIAIYVAYIIFEDKKYDWNSIKNNPRLKQFITASVYIILFSAVFVSLLAGPASFMEFLNGPFSFTKIKDASMNNLWPNVYTTVAELNSASFGSVVGSIGGQTLFYFSLLGILFLLLSKKEGKRDNIHYAALIILWYIGIFYASNKGIRFTMMLVPPLALAIGTAISEIYGRLIEYMKEMGVSPKITGAVVIAIFLLMFIPYTKGVSNEVKTDIPIVNDAWYESLHKIKIESKEDAIINSWWDFGHHFKYFADRAVTFDGASQGTPMAHWIGRVLLTNNEKEAIGILRMLDCGSNDAFEELNGIVNNAHKSVDMLYDIIVMDKAGAKSYLSSKGINDDASEKILKLTHCNPPEDYFITSEDMVGKAPVWAHFGSWDFNKADAWINARNLPRDESISYIKNAFETTNEEASKIYSKIQSITDEGEANNWIASWPGYSGDANCDKQDTMLTCGGVRIDLTTMDASINTDKGPQVPSALVYVENNNIVKKSYQGSIDQSILLIKTGDSYKIVISSTALADSMFSRLFYFEGAGAPHFEKFSDKVSFTNERIIVWKVKW